MESQEILNKLIEYGAIHLGSGDTNIKDIRGGGGLLNVGQHIPNQRYDSLEGQVRFTSGPHLGVGLQNDGTVNIEKILPKLTP